jgi:hypothetical protein
MNLEYLIGLIGITMFLSCSQKNAQQESNVQISVQEDDTQKENKQEANVQKGIKYEVRSNEIGRASCRERVFVHV